MIAIAANRFKEFQRKRMEIFGELAKRFWRGEINDHTDLDKLADEIRDKYGFQEAEITFIKDHIRIAMGLDPRGTPDFADEIELVKNSPKILKPIVAKVDEACKHCSPDERTCKDVCKYEANVYRREGPVIEDDKCLSCGECVTSCDFGALADKIEFIPLISWLQNEHTDVYAAVAPAIVGQFGENIAMGQLRTALKILGFKDMIEVALFADILTIKEAFEFNRLVKTEQDFFLTSCCCPVWLNLTKKNYPEIFAHMSPSVSPMIAAGRILKKLYQDAKVVFISPCIAKKAEVQEPDLKGDIDFVISFPELKEIFTVLDINLAELSPENKDQASFAGRVYARAGGVSFSVKTVVNRIEPRRLIKLKARKVAGVKACKDILDKLSQGEKIQENFIEGMGCEGGCVGGPRTNIAKERATALVNEFGEDSLIMTPFDNLNVMKILSQLGIGNIEEIVENEELRKLLTRVY
ncbi:MAG: [Fe-Fe] hydrogenase large subunit C-terminal domain-containing protein [Peptococcaceae bacterium]